MNRYILGIAAVGCLLAACGNEEVAPAQQESIEVCFTAQLPATRVEALNVDKVVCAVFEDDTEIPTLREIIAPGETYSPRLILGQEYTVVFWAMKDGAYDVSNLKEVSQNRTGTTFEELDYDAFTYKEKFTVEANTIRTITLHRPLARLTVGISKDENEAIAALNYSLTKMEYSISDVYDSYNALMGAPAGSSKTVKFTVGVNDDNDSYVTSNGKQYRPLTMHYVIADGTSTVTYAAWAKKTDALGNLVKEAEKVVENLEITGVTLRPNFNTNVFGDLLTNAPSYTITFENDYSIPE